MRFIHDQDGYLVALSARGETDSREDKRFAADKESEYEGVLELLWLTEEVAFGFSTEMKPEISEVAKKDECPTKRQMLKCLMSLFDPLGLLSIFVVHGKILLQEVWRSGAPWDS